MGNEPIFHGRQSSAGLKVWLLRSMRPASLLLGAVLIALISITVIASLSIEEDSPQDHLHMTRLPSDRPATYAADSGSVLENVERAVGQLICSVKDSDGVLSDNTSGDSAVWFAGFADYTSRVEETLQNPELPGGCELASLTAVLRSMGFDLTLTEIADEHLTYDEDGGFVYGYAGSPYGMGGGFPPCIVDAANSYLASHGSDSRAHDMTGSSFSELIDLVGRGYPVLIWTTIDMERPWMSEIYVDGYEWYDNEHCVVLCDSGEWEVLVNDPLVGLVYRDAEEFAYIYEACGSMAVAIA